MKRETRLGQMLVKAYANGYRIDEDGNVISPTDRILKPTFKCKNNKSYKYFSFKDDGKVIKIPYHGLQAYHKFGDDIFMVDTIRHLNGNCQDNSYNNIAIGSYHDNSMDRTPEDRKKQASHPKYNHQEVIDYHLTNGRSYKRTMEKFNIPSKGTLFFILKKERE